MKEKASSLFCRVWWHSQEEVPNPGVAGAQHASFHDVYRSPFTDGSLLNWTPSDLLLLMAARAAGVGKELPFSPPPHRRPKSVMLLFYRSCTTT
jgi:hypothetical protein